MQVLKVDVGKLPDYDNIENTYEDIRSYVGGYIEAIRIRDDIVMWINEEGKILKLPINFALGYKGKIYDFICGNAIFTGVDETGETIGLTQEMVEFILHSFKITEDERLVLENNR